MPYLLLELQGAHRGDRLEVVEARDAHPELLYYVLDPERTVEVFAQPLQRPGDEVAISTGERSVPQPASLLSHEESVDDLPSHHRRQETRFGWRVQEPDEPDHGVEQAGVQRANVDCLHGGVVPPARSVRPPYVVLVLAAAGLAMAGRGMLSESRAAKLRPVDAVGTLLLAAFVAAEHRIANPMLDLVLFRRPDFVWATVVAVSAEAGKLALSCFVPMLVERGLGESTVLAAIMLLSWSATSVGSALGARWLPDQVTPRILLIGGLIGIAAGQLALFGIGPGSSVERLLPGLIVAGAANGILNATLGRQAVASVPADRAAMGSGVNNTARYVGSAIGIAVVAVFINGTDSVPGAASVVSGWNIAALVTTAFSLLGALTVVLSRERRSDSEPDLQDTVESIPPQCVPCAFESVQNV